MTVGLNVLFEVVTIAQGPDDDVGGAVITGSISNACVWGRFVESKPSQFLLQQGIETKNTAVAIVRAHGQSGTVSIVERDEIKVVSPANHEYIGRRFRVVAVEHMPTHPSDRRNLMRLWLERFDTTRREEWL